MNGEEEKKDGDSKEEVIEEEPFVPMTKPEQEILEIKELIEP